MNDRSAIDKDAIMGVIRFISERGYGIKWDNKEQCYRIMLLSLTPEKDEYINKKFTTIGQAYYEVLQLIEKSPPY